jgi:LSD1 subclass zinc finger protein
MLLICEGCGARLQVARGSHAIQCPTCDTHIIVASALPGDATASRINATDVVAAELTLARLKQEYADVTAHIEYLEGEHADAADECDDEGILDPGAAAAANARLPELRAARDRSLIPTAGLTLMIVLIVAFLIGVMAADTWFARFVAVVVWGAGCIVVYFVTMAVVAYVDSERDERLRVETAALDDALFRHESALRNREKLVRCDSSLTIERARKRRIEHQISQNRRVIERD